MKYVFSVVVLVFMCLGVGCSSNKTAEYNYSALESQSNLASTINTRLIQQSAYVGVKVDSVKESTAAVYELVAAVEGYVETASNYSEDSSDIVIKVPAAQFDLVVEQLKKLGEVTSERIYSRDVTDEVIDIEAKLDNLVELRARFRQLLARAEKVDEVLSIERELSRIQTEIDSIEGRKKSLIGNVEQSSIDVKLQQKVVLGPLGYLGKGIYWVISKLFVIK